MTPPRWTRGLLVKRPPFVFVTDPGPDPDDAKALLVASLLHLHAHIELVAVVCNGGGQPRERARLARCLLDHVGATLVPVGVGSEGVASAAQPHEYNLRGYAEVDPARLLNGAELLLRTLQLARRRSLRVVLISSLRDFADLCASHAELVLDKVHTVAIQGGLEPSTSSPSGWQADTSVNNSFDMAAANAVYSFCFAHDVRLAVVSRFAVPLLPMQLAKSFADRTNCPVMRYLAEAQFLGLKGLWLKLCAGSLPPRCTKQWYFETFCGVSADTFALRKLDGLGADAQIETHLNGYVKPYVVALMTVLPQTQALFPWPTSRTSAGADKLLMLTAANAIPSSAVLNLLRDAYHEVVLQTVGMKGATINPEGGRRLRLRGRFGLVTAAAQPPDVRLSQPSQARAPPDAFLLKPSEIVRVLSCALDQALAQQRWLSSRTTFGGLALFLVSLAALAADWIMQRRANPGLALLALYDTNDGFALRTHLYVVSCLLAAVVLCFSLSGTSSTVVRTRIVCFALACGTIGVWAMIFFPSFAEITLPSMNNEFAETGWTKYYRADLEGDARYSWQTWRAAMIAYYSVRTVGYALAPVMAMTACLLRWNRVRSLTSIVFFSTGLTVLVQGISDLWAVSMLVESGLRRAPWLVAGVFCIGALALSVGAALFTPHARRHGQAVIVSLVRMLNRDSSEAIAEASLAPLCGFGSRRGEREPEKLVADAVRFFAPVIVTAAMLRAQGEAIFTGESERKRDLPRKVSLPFKGAHTRSRSHSSLAIEDLVTMEVATSADCYVVYSPSSPAAANLAALIAWVEEFERAHGRGPSVWIDVLCADLSLSSVELLEHIPVYLARSKRLLLLASPELPERLWSAVECWVWFVIGRKTYDVDISIVRPPNMQAANAVSAFDSFHVMWSLSTEGADVRRRLEHAVELASIHRFNAKLRELMPLVKRAAERHDQQGEEVVVGAGDHPKLLAVPQL